MLKEKNMRKLIILLVCMLVTFSWSCKKNNDNSTPSIPVEGFWEGKYGSGTSVPQRYFAFKILKDGELKVYADGIDSASSGKAKGRYFYADGKISGTYTYINNATFSFAAEFYNNNKAIKGTYGVNANPTGGGTFELFKK